MKVGRAGLYRCGRVPWARRWVVNQPLTGAWPVNRAGFDGGGECTEDSLSGVRRGKYPEELRGWAARRAEGVVPAPGRDSQTSSRIPASCPSSTPSHTPWRTCS